MASLTRWTWVWASPWSWWWTRKPGVLQATGSQRVRHDWATELNWTYIHDRGFPGGSDGEESAYNAGIPGSIPGLGRSPGKGNGYPLQYSCLKNPMDRGPWQAIVHRAAKSWTQLSMMTMIEIGTEEVHWSFRDQKTHYWIGNLKVHHALLSLL